MVASCSICGEDIRISSTYECNYCGKTHCTDHRLPEQHACSGLARATNLGPEIRRGAASQVVEADWAPAEPAAPTTHPDPPGWMGWLLLLVILLAVWIAAMRAFGWF